MEARPTLIAIVGPTASGKTALAITLAKRWNGEIIAADSRTIYRDMDIGTAKPTPYEREQVVHWGLDLVSPDERFNVSEFKQYADDVLQDIQQRGKLPIIVGGTGLYVDAVLYDFSFQNKASVEQLKTLEAMTLNELYEVCTKRNIPLPYNFKNKRHVVRAIVQSDGINSSKKPLATGTYIVGIATNRKTLRDRIIVRGEHMFENGVVEEATMLGKKYGWNHESMTGNIYPLIKRYSNNELTRNEVIEQFVTLDYRLAKRQMTWLRRNPDIMWATLADAQNYINRLFVVE